MPASFPTSAKAFTTKSNGAGNTIDASHINDVQAEITAIEQCLLGSTSLDAVLTSVTAATSMGLAATAKLYLDGIAMSGDTYIQESTANTLSLVSGGIAVHCASGVITANGAGTHTFSAATATGNILATRNTTDGTGAYASVQVGNNAAVAVGNLYALAASYTTAGPLVAGACVLTGTTAPGLVLAATHASGPVIVFSGNTERARFLAAGGLVWGATAQLGSTPAGMASKVNQSTTYGFCSQPVADVGGGKFFAFLNAAGTEQGTITATNDSATAFNTTSDKRLKHDLGLATDCSVLQETVIHKFTWKSNGMRSRGIFAQDEVARAPFAIVRGDDSDAVVTPWAVDYSKYVPDLIVGWQQHDAAIVALRAEIAALRSETHG